MDNLIYNTRLLGSIYYCKKESGSCENVNNENNFFINGRGLQFEVETNQNQIVIDKIFIRIKSTTFKKDRLLVYAKDGNLAGFENDMSARTLIESMSICRKCNE